MAGMDEWVAFPRARLDEEEVLAKRGEEIFTVGWPDYQTYDSPELDDASRYLDQFGPARALRDVAAGRRILARHSPAEGMAGPCCTWCSDDTDTASLNEPWPCPDVLDLLSRWAGHPDYPGAKKSAHSS